MKSFEEEKGNGVHELWWDMQTEKERFSTLHIYIDMDGDSLYVQRKCDFLNWKDCILQHLKLLVTSIVLANLAIS